MLSAQVCFLFRNFTIEGPEREHSVRGICLACGSPGTNPALILGIPYGLESVKRDFWASGVFPESHQMWLKNQVRKEENLLLSCYETVKLDLRICM